MIYWLVQSAYTHPQLAQGIPPEGLLNPTEYQQFNRIHHDKRRAQWLLGRWTAKHLIQRLMASQSMQPPDLPQLHIHNRHTGEPIVLINNQHCYSLSISHSHDHALCAILEKTNERIGVDIERIEPRTMLFIEDYFTEAETALLYGIPDDYFDTLVTAIWSAKEAVLKALHLGLSVDTRRVTCLPDPSGMGNQWSPFTIIVDTQRLQRTVPVLYGHWCIYQEYVLTLVAQHNTLLTRIRGDFIL